MMTRARSDRKRKTNSSADSSGEAPRSRVLQRRPLSAGESLGWGLGVGAVKGKLGVCMWRGLCGGWVSHMIMFREGSALKPSSLSTGECASRSTLLTSRPW